MLSTCKLKQIFKFIYDFVFDQIMFFEDLKGHLSQHLKHALFFMLSDIYLSKPAVLHQILFELKLPLMWYPLKQHFIVITISSFLLFTHNKAESFLIQVQFWKT